MKNIVIVETCQNLPDFLASINLSNDVVVWIYKDDLFEKNEFILSKNSILVIKQSENLQDIELNTLKDFSLNNTVFVLTYNLSLLRMKYKKEYFLLKPLLGLIYEGNTITRFGANYSSSS